jgi:hypothetical protein
MTMNTTRKFIAAVALAAASTAGLSGVAHADTGGRGWIELESVTFGDAGGGGGGGEDCWDWTNEDGTTGSTCTAVVVLRWEKLRVP